MSRNKMIYVAETTHRQLKILAARRNTPMGRLVEEMVQRELEESSNFWLTPPGLSLQEKALGEVWADPALDVYND